MKMVEQNISGVKLEQLRQNAVKKHKILRKLLPVCLILFIGLTLVKKPIFVCLHQRIWLWRPSNSGGLLGSDRRHDAQCDFCGCCFCFLLYAGL